MQEIEAAYQLISEKYKGDKPQIGIILGTGLGVLVNDVEVSCEVPLDDDPVKSTNLRQITNIQKIEHPKNGKFCSTLS